MGREYPPEGFDSLFPMLLNSAYCTVAWENDFYTLNPILLDRDLLPCLAKIVFFCSDIHR